MRTIAPLWRELHASQKEATLFQRFETNEIAARVFGQRERPYVVVVESDSAAAIIPACIARDHVSLLGEELFDYRGPIASDAEIIESAWSEIDQLGLPLRVKATRGRVNWGEMRPYAGAPSLPASQKPPRKKKHERNARLLADRGCTFAFHPQNIAEYGNLVRRIYQLKGRSEAGSLFVDPLRINAVVEMASATKSEVFTCEKDGELVAAILAFIDGNVCRFYGTYYDARWAVFSPGVTLLYQLIRHAQRRDLDFDFMTGEQAYKMRFATEVVPLYIAERRAAASLAA
jgi:CelD/BcsL family acetyltransferase involved in cellulose biosynthesis